MTIYSQKDVRVKINDSDLYCSNVNLLYDNEVNPVVSVGARGGYDYSPNGPAKGGFKINYFLTGSDPLSSGIMNDTTPISLYFAGLTVNSGYLTSYSFSAEPHSVVEISASFDFYEQINGTFTKQASPLPDIAPLNVSDLSLSNGNIIAEDKIRSLSYSYSADLKPSFEVQSSINYDGNSPVGVVRGSPPKVESSLSLYDYDLSLPITGLRESFDINFKDKNGNTEQTFSINGVIKNKGIGAKIGDNVISDYTIGQANLGGSLPNITGIYPTSGSVGSTVAISGENFIDIDSVYLGEFKCDISGAHTATKINAIISEDIISGYRAAINVITHGGESSRWPTATPPSYHVTSGLTYYF